MEITTKENIESFSLPLPIYKSIHIADAVSKDGIKFSIFMGLDKELVAQVEKYSADENDVDLQKYTKDKKRFVEGKYEDWYRKNRTPFALVDNETGVMAAIMRFGPEPLHDGCKCHTIGWRSYKPYRGTGIMKDFAKFTFDFYKKYFPEIKFWITVKKENTGSIKLAEFLGFKLSDQKIDEVSLVMIK